MELLECLEFNELLREDKNVERDGKEGSLFQREAKAPLGPKG